MNIKNMTKEEIETLSYTDLTFILLKDKKKAMTTSDIFKKICEILELSDETFSEKIGEFYTSLTIDKRFAMLSDGKWDLRENHAIEIHVDDDDEAEDEEMEETEEEEETDELDETEDDVEVPIEEDDIDVDDELDDLTVLDEEELDEEN